MKEFITGSDIGSVLIGNTEWTFAVPNGEGDGITTVYVFDSQSEFDHHEKIISAESYISCAQGVFNIYAHDCAFMNIEKAQVVTSLFGRYGIYAEKQKVVFVRWGEANE